jgi:hypothetical protein
MSCAVPQAAPLFLISLALICSYVATALAVAVVFDAVRACGEQLDAPGGVPAENAAATAAAT